MLPFQDGENCILIRFPLQNNNLEYLNYNVYANQIARIDSEIELEGSTRGGSKSIDDAENDMGRKADDREDEIQGWFCSATSSSQS